MIFNNGVPARNHDVKIDAESLKAEFHVSLIWCGLISYSSLCRLHNVITMGVYYRGVFPWKGPPAIKLILWSKFWNFHPTLQHVPHRHIIIIREKFDINISWLKNSSNICEFLSIGEQRVKIGLLLYWTLKFQCWSLNRLKT